MVARATEDACYEPGGSDYDECATVDPSFGIGPCRTAADCTDRPNGYCQTQSYNEYYGTPICGCIYGPSLNPSQRHRFLTLREDVAPSDRRFTPAKA